MEIRGINWDSPRQTRMCGYPAIELSNDNENSLWAGTVILPPLLPQVPLTSSPYSGCSYRVLYTPFLVAPACIGVLSSSQDYLFTPDQSMSMNVPKKHSGFSFS